MKGEQAKGKIRLAIMLYAGLGTLAVNLLPAILSGSTLTSNTRPVLYLTAFSLIGLTGLALWITKDALELDTKWWRYAFAYSSLIVLIKFVVSPAGFIGRSNASFTQLLLTAGFVMLLYLLGFWLVYAYFTKQLPIKPKNSGGKLAGEEQKLIFTSVAFLVINFARLIVQRLPLPGISGGSNYLKAIYGYQGLALSALVFLAVLTAVEAFDQVKSNHTQLKGFLWVGVELIIINHILWAIFMSRLA